MLSSPHLSGYITNSHNDHAAPSWLDSSIGRALHRYRRGHGFESQKIKKDQALLGKLSFDKESCLITNKNNDFYYF